MSRMIVIEKKVQINAPISDVWKVSAIEFENIDQWDGNVRTSESLGASRTSAPISGRVCHMYSGGKTKERFVEFDENVYSFAYEIAQGLPGFVVSAHNHWSHSAISSSETQLSMRVVMHVKGILGFLMQVPIKAQMAKVLTKAQEELKYYIENGRAHPRKQKKLKKK